MLFRSYINNPKSSKACFDLAEWYYKQNQWAGAITYYIKVTEIDDNKDLTYFSLIKSGRALHKQTHQTYQAKGLYLLAVEQYPERTEGWFWLSKTYVELREWLEGLGTAEAGLRGEDSVTDVDLEYDGKWGLEITKANCLLEINRLDEAGEIYTKMLGADYVDDRNKEWCLQMMKNIWGPNYVLHTYYTKDKTLKHNFEGLDNIKRNYSQAYQDLFVLTALNGKKNGTYVEIGACDPKLNNNTHLLENDFGWNGISFEIDGNLVDKFNGIRENKCIIGDATGHDYKSIFKLMNFPNIIDYLQLDIEPAKNTFDAMLAIPMDEYKFRIITYEHDAWCDDKSYREKSRKWLEFNGYELIVSDVSFGCKERPFEDWWVHKDLFDKEWINKMKWIGINKQIDEYFY